MKGGLNMKLHSQTLSLGCAAAMLVCMAAFALTARAQTFFGSIVGTATDSSGAVVPGAAATLTNTGTSEERTTRTDASGNYSFVSLRPGTYGITVQAAGFKRVTRQPITVAVESVVRIDASLEVGEATQAVEVRAETPLLQTQTSTLGQVVEHRQVQDLPLNGRNVLNLAALVPGVVQQGSAGGNPVTNSLNSWGNYQIGGGAANQSAAYIDGVPINISYCQMMALIPTQDAIQEFHVETNNISPEFGRSAGGVLNMSTKSGTNEYHGDLYEYLRNTDLNANNFFNNRAGLRRPEWVQNQFGATLGGPIRKDKTFFFLSWENFDLRQAFSTLTTVPTPQMLMGDFSQKGVPTIFDPLTTCGTSGNSACPTDASGNPVYTRQPFAGNVIPATRLNQAAGNLASMLWPAATNPTAVVNNFQINYPGSYVYNQYTARFDHKLGSKQQIFGRYTYWHFPPSPTNPLMNVTGRAKVFSTHQAVLGDTILVGPTTVVDLRLSFLRFPEGATPYSCCNFQYSKIGPGWAAYQGQAQFSELPMPNVVGMYNLSGVPFVSETDNSYNLSGSLTKVVGRHTLKFGGEARRIEWSYFQSNTVGGTFTADSGFTSQLPLVGSGPGSPATTGYGFASWMLGFPSAGSAQEPVLSFATLYYAGLYANDSFRVTNKLTLNLGLRWEQPGSFHERHDSMTTFALNLPQTALSQATGLNNLQGGLALVNSPQYSSRDWQILHWKLFSPRVGFAYNPAANWVVRGGYGILFLPNTSAFALGPYNVPVNMSTTTMVTSLAGGLTPYLATTLSKPFQNGLVAPPGHNQAYVNSLVGQGVDSPLPDQPAAYAQQWNLDVQRQFGEGLMIDVGYAGARGVHLPLYSVNLDQLPDQYDTMGSALLTQVKNPFYGVLPSNVGALGQPTVMQGYLLKPYPQYLYMSALGPTAGDSYYHALQVKIQKRLASGVLLISYAHSKLTGTTDTLTPWNETNSKAVGGGNGVQDNDNIAGEKSLGSFDVPNRLVISYVYQLPFGKGQKFLSGTQGVAGKAVSGWSLNGITSFQSGFPLGLTTASPNTLANYFAVGNAGPGTGAGVTRPNYVGGCDPVLSGAAQSRISQWFNTACYVAPGAFSWGNEPRVDPAMRAAGINNFDLAVSKRTQLAERFNLEFRGEFFNLFNRVQFGVPTTQLGSAQFGMVTSQQNQPRCVQFGLRLEF